MAVEEAKLIIRLGTHAEKDYLDKTIQFLDGILIGANLIEATPGATASLLIKFSGARIGCPYYVDPMSYAYGCYIDPSTGRMRGDLDWIKSEQKIQRRMVRTFKKSYVKLAKELGYPFTEAIARDSALTPNDFSNPREAESVCRSVIEYQLNRIRTEFERDPEFQMYADEVPLPAAVFSPYFYIEPSDWEQWTDFTLRFAKICAGLPFETPSYTPVYSVICADETFLENEIFLNQLREDLPKTGIDGVWLWFSKFREDKATTKKLTAFRSLVEDLSKKMKVYNMHGGYFSLALSYYGLSGVSHGIGYGEQKDVVPVIGQSTPTVRYYLPEVHRRLGVPQIERCFNALGVNTPTDFFQKICGCVICRGVLARSLSDFSQFGDTRLSTPGSRRLSQTPAAAKRCRFHYLLARIKERDWLRKVSLKDIVLDLDDAWSKWSPQSALNGEIEHLKKWRAALS